MTTTQGQFPDLPPTRTADADIPAEVGKPRLLRAERAQQRWLVTDLESLLEQEHPARAVWVFVQGLDLSRFMEGVRSVEGHAGRPAIDPAILLSLWLFGLSEGVGSARELERLCDEHDAYRWLCGGVAMNYHTLSDFRGQGEVFEELLTQSLAVLTKEGLLTLKRVAQDGMRVRASAGAASFHQRETLETHLRKARAHIEQLRDEALDTSQSARQKAARARAARERAARVERALALLPEAEATLERRKEPAAKARVSTTDPEARVMKMADGGFRPALNVEVAADTATHLIVGVDVVNIGNDMGQLPPMLDQIEKRLGRLPKEMLVDGGFPSEGSLEAAHARGVTLYAPVQKPREPERDRYLPRARDSEAKAQWRERMGTPEAKDIYKQRGSTAEWVNARLRRHSLSCFLVRGLDRARGVLVLAALAHNLFRVRTIKRQMAARA